MSATTWDLDGLFQGGIGGAAYTDALGAVDARIDALALRVDTLGDLPEQQSAWRAVLREYLDVDAHIQEIAAFATCCSATDTHDPAIPRAEAAARNLRIRLHGVRTPIEATLDALAPEVYDLVVHHPSFEDAAPYFDNRRRGSHLRLPPAEQALMVRLDREALHAWGSLYRTTTGKLTATLDGGETSVATAAGLRGHPDEATRRGAHEALGTAWHGVRELCATMLTHLTGARQTRHDLLGVDDLESSLDRNRLERATLDAMWTAADEARPHLLAYLAAKARLLGKDRLDWWDQAAPLGAGGSLSWARATSLIVESFEAFDPRMAAFARHALASGWIDGRPGPARRQGGFCAKLPIARQSRIFLTFTETFRTATTLAHELGHGWHNVQILSVPYARQNVTSALAETASTFAEAMFRDRALATATDPGAALGMLDQQCQAGVVFLMNIPARFAFERRLHELRRHGELDPDQLDDEMVACQRAAYGDALASWDPTFWASKLHFYLSSNAYYNWPYAFGYLFSSAVYARAQAEGPGFRRQLDELLKLTGHAWTEPLTEACLQADPTRPEFWRDAVRPLVQHLDDFVAAAQKPS